MRADKAIRGLRSCPRSWSGSLIAALIALHCLSSATAVAQVLPEGNVGIAAKYPGDVGISGDAAVVFSDNFESYTSVSGLTSRWSEVFHSANLRIANEAANVFAGAKAVEMTVPKQSAEVSNNLIRYLSPATDVLFVRYYAKLDAGFDVLGSSHNGNSISAKYCCPGVKADGYNKFLVSLEAWRDDVSTRNPGNLNIYIYHPDQRDVWGDHFFPTGRVVPYDAVPGNFGSGFVARPNVIPELGRWYSYELMVKANTPGLRDGRIAVWIDGKLVADFPNLRLRDTSALKIDQFTIDLHVRSNTLSAARKWVDNVVAATSYIGPMAASVTLPPPTALQVR